jgi:uncharacterized damage-inducible protein DinB
MEITDLIWYNHFVRGLYLDALAKLQWSEVVEPKGLSFDSLRNVFLHLTLVEDRWVSYIIPGRFKEWVDLDFDSFKDMPALKKYTQHVQSNTESYISRLLISELRRELVIPWGDKPDTRVSVETALTHLVVEDMIHFGELSAVLWQKGLEAPYLGFWRFKQAQA